MGKKELMSSNNFMDIYVLARWGYKVGEPLLNDDVFDVFEEKLKKLNPDLEIFNTSWSEDDEPIELLNKYEISLISEVTPVELCETGLQKYLPYLIDNKSLSIRPIRSYEMAYEWFKLFDGMFIIFSVKIDGVNMKVLLSLESGLLLAASSRGRKTDKVFDYSVGAIQRYPNKFKKSGLRSKVESNNLLVYCEGLVVNEGREEINKRYDKKYVNEKTCGLPCLVKGIDNDLEQHLKVYAHSASTGDATMSESLASLERAGFDVVPNITEKYVDEGFDKFVEWIDEIQKRVNTLANENNLVFDGVVAQVNSFEEFNNCEYNEVYSNGNIALKFGENSCEEYEATVKDIELVFEGKSKEKYTTKLYLEPIKLSDNKILSKLQGYNLSVIVSNNIKKGSVVKILYQSQCDPILKL